MQNSSDSSVVDTVEGGNSISPSRTSKQISPSIRWSFTMNNYGISDEEEIQSSIKRLCKVGFYNREVGESGTPHLQGYIEFLKKSRPLNLFPRGIHWEKSKGSLKDNQTYCEKDALGKPMTFEHGLKRKTPLRVIQELRPWQASVMQYIDLEMASDNDRTINWIVDKQGKSGKTQLCKYMSTVVPQLVIITGGQYKDIACVLSGLEEDKEYDFNDKTVVVFNIPRDADAKGLISYKALESLKDGLITSTKYQSRTLVFNSPSVWVFSNENPTLEKLSLDRWEVWNIKNDQLVARNSKRADHPISFDEDEY